MANVNTAWPQNHIGFLGANCSQYPVGSVIIASSKRRSITTPSRRRRIIFETARSITHLYIEKSLHRHIQEVDASIILQTYVRGHAARNEFQSILKLRDEACIRIQSQVRSQQAIKTFKVLLNDNLSYEQSHAATTIAAVFRRKKAIDLAQRRSLEKARKAEMNAMVIKAQTFLRGALARKKVEEMRLLELHMECAAIVIQSFVRTVFTKHTYVSTRYREHVEPSVILVQRALRRYQAISRRRTLMQSVVRLQIWWRDIVVHLKTAAVFNVKNFSSICSSSIHSINSAKTPELDQEETQRLLSPETKPEEQILETFGAFSSEFETPTTSSVDISSIQSDDTCVVIEPDEESLHSEKNETQNAAIIQQAFRTFYQRKKMAFLAQQTANDSINLATELVLDYRWDLLIFAAATKVQALVRGYSDRRKVESMAQGLYRDIIETYRTYFESNHWIPDKFKAEIFPMGSSEFDFNNPVSASPTTEAGPPHSNVSNDPFLREFLKYLPPSSLPVAGCDLSGIDLEDPKNLITMTVDFSKGTKN